MLRLIVYGFPACRARTRNYGVDPHDFVLNLPLDLPRLGFAKQIDELGLASHRIVGAAGDPWPGGVTLRS